MTNKEQDIKYIKAKEKVDKIRRFYLHVSLFCVVLLLMLVLPLFDISFCFICIFKDYWANLLVSFAPWFLFICFQGLTVFGKIGFLKNWEEKKLKQFLED